MLKITAERLSHAAALAAEIEMLESSKDQLRDVKHTSHVGMMRFEVPVSAGAARAEVTNLIEKATAELAAMGFELLPPAAPAEGAASSAGRNAFFAVAPSRLGDPTEYLGVNRV